MYYVYGLVIQCEYYLIYFVRYYLIYFCRIYYRKWFCFLVGRSVKTRRGRIIGILRVGLFRGSYFFLLFSMLNKLYLDYFLLRVFQYVYVLFLILNLCKRCLVRFSQNNFLVQIIDVGKLQCLCYFNKLFKDKVLKGLFFD